jgi:hypothetical protein
MSIDQAMANLNEAKAKHAKSIAGKKSKVKKKPHASMFRIRKDRKKGFVLETKKEIRNLVGSNNAIRDVVRFYAERHFGVEMAATVNGLGYLVFWGGENTLTGSMASELVRLASARLAEKYKLDPAKIRAEEKQNKLAKMYGTKSDKPMAEKYGYGYTSNSYGSASTSTTVSSYSDWK